jgi:hypothetical protein
MGVMLLVLQTLVAIDFYSKVRYSGQSTK